VRILVTGAAGYIGSIVTEQLVTGGHDVIALDDLRHGHRRAVHPEASFVEASIVDGAAMRRLMSDTKPDAVVHLAAEALIDESIRNPGRFYEVNVVGGLSLLEAMAASSVNKLVFSSTAAVYGEPEAVPITEDMPHAPVNSYGESKLAFERMLPWYQRAYDLQHVTLRYFNAAGATRDYGENHRPETHLIPALFEVALGQREALQLFGTDYDTPDGTCIRDYIHVSDIAQAHVLALTALDDVRAAAYNMGNGTGYSNAQVIECVRQVTGEEIPVKEAPRRPGDPARLVASSEKIRRELGWEPAFGDMETIVRSAWEWRRRHPHGYTA